MQHLRPRLQTVTCPNHIRPTITRQFIFCQQIGKIPKPSCSPYMVTSIKYQDEALNSRTTRTAESFLSHSRPLLPVVPGDTIFIYNQQENNPTKWNRSDTVIESLSSDQYTIKTDGSSASTVHKHRILRDDTLTINRTS